MSSNSLVRRALWFIAEHRNNRMEVLTINAGDGEALPVFSFEEEAELFLRHFEPETSWRARGTTTGELISILYGPCSGVEKVALDPTPEIDGKAMLDLVSLGRKDFVRTLMDKEGPAEPGRRRSLPEKHPPATPLLEKEERQGAPRSSELRTLVRAGYL